MTSPRWPGVVITRWHYFPRSKGARVTVSVGDRNIVSSESGEGMSLDAPNLVRFFDWAREFYDGAPVHEISEDRGRQIEAKIMARQKPKRRRSTQESS